jgi:NAD(P)-dependent dehydrogenase (short-subunit alcohol dehydrogenase family)
VVQHLLTGMGEEDGNDMESLNEAVVVVTGASRSGIGGAVARRFAAPGTSLFLTSVDDEDSQELAGECRAAGAEVAWAVHDLSRPDAADRMIAEAFDLFGRIDVLVNNAGLRILRPFGEFSGDEFDRVVAVNLRAPFLASQAVVPIMRAQGGGRIVHVASQLGVVTQATFALYSATKAALISLTRSMALELSRDGISVNAVSPGPVATGYLEQRLDQDPDARDGMIAKMPVGRLGDPDEVAEAVMFLATSRGTLIQGHNLVLDGGYTLQ